MSSYLLRFLKKEDFKFYLFAGFLILLNILFLNNIIIQNSQLELDKIYLIILCISVLFEIILAYLLMKFYRKKWKIENLFLVMAITTGILYMMAIPVGLVPDEKSHFLRAYEFSKGYITSDTNEDGRGGRVLPIEAKSVIADTIEYKYEDLTNNFKVKNSGEKDFLIFSNTSLYSVVCYIPQTLGILIAKVLHLPMLGIAYFGRIFNFAAWIAIMYFSLKFIPCYKTFFILIALLPITMQEAVSLSPDSLTIAIAFAMISFVLYMIKSKKDKMNKKELAIMCILATIMSLCKIVYLPLCLILFLIPEERFNSKKDKYKKIILLALFVVIINIIWLAIASKYLVEFQPGVDSAEQVKFIIKNPFNYIQVLTSSVIEKCDFYLFGCLGKSLEWFNINLPYLYPLITFGLIIFTIEKDTKYETFTKVTTRIGTLSILIITILLIFTSLYVQWTKVGNSVVEGVQGRYFLPLLLLLPILFTTIKDKKIKKIQEENNYQKYVFMFLIIQNVMALITIFYTHI